jgi:hypothetical protein
MLRIARLALSLAAWLMYFSAACASAQQSDTHSGSASQPEVASPVTVDDPAATLLPHRPSDRFWISAQDNILFQYHPSFSAQYSGVNSLHAHSENATSDIGTLYLGYAPHKNTELYLDMESAGGGGLSDALGVAGFTNVDVVRNPQLGVTPYIARGLIRQIVSLSEDIVEGERGPFSLESRLPARRLEFRFGKFSLPDFFDLNTGSGDSHSQFLNWTIVNNGAWDYAADTRGYTVGFLAEYDDRSWAFRFAEALMPSVANGIDYQWNLRFARAENYELELHPRLAGRQQTAIRLLAFENHANMGVYEQAINNFLAGRTPRPDITAHPLRTTIKYGFGANVEQHMGGSVTAFARWGWNEGQHESFAYTEVDASLQVGADVAGEVWHRRRDKFGAAAVSNGISAAHQKYLALGGRGFLLGDGGLNYGRELVFESYYNLHVWRGVFTGPDLQHINNAGYNRARGPVWVPGARLHLDF